MTNQKIRESQIEKALVKSVKQAGGECRKAQWIGRRGAPDRLVMLPGGITWWVELKAPGKKPDPHQSREHKRMTALGQTIYVIDSLESIERLLNGAIPVT